MHHRISLYPQLGDEPHGHLSGVQGDIPVLDLDPRAEIAFHDLDSAVTYLDALADEATMLAARIRQRQRGETDLLAAVRSTRGTS